MPKIQVNERDKSWYYRQRQQGPLVVFMPGISNWGSLEPTLVDESNYSLLIGDSAVPYNEDFSYQMAVSLMKVGISVLFWRVNPYSSETKEGDTSGISILSCKVLADNAVPQGGSEGDDVSEPSDSERSQGYTKVTRSTTGRGQDGQQITYEVEYITNNEGAGEVNAIVNVNRTESYKEKEDGSKTLYISSAKEVKVVNYSNGNIYEVVTVENYDDSGSSFATRETTETYNSRAFLRWYGYNEDDGKKIVIKEPANPFSKSHILFEAKYSGEMGNRLSVEMYGTGATRVVRVYKKDPGSFNSSRKLVESLTYDFKDINSPYYFETVNMNSQYVEVTPVFTAESQSDPKRFDNLPGSITRDLLDENSKSIKLYLKNGSNGVLDINGKVDHGLKEDELSYELDKIKIINNLLSRAKTEDVVDNLKDPLIYHYDVIIDGGYNDNYNLVAIGSNPSDVDRLWVKLARQRGTAVYLVSGSSTMGPSEFYDYCGLPTSDGLLPSDPPYAQTKDYSELDTFNTSYASAFGPWCVSVLSSNGSVRLLPGYYPFLVAWGNSLAQGNPPWAAPAGVKRSNLDNIVKGTSYLMGSSVIDMWQNQDFIANYESNNNGRSGLYSVNPIAHLRGYGFTVYGNSTLLKNRYDGATSMLQLFSVRILCNMIKSRAYDVSLYLQFDQLSAEVFGEFKTLMSLFMDQLKYGGAIYDYDISADYSLLTLEDINNRVVPVTIRISPTPTAENFVINLEINQAGITFGSDSAETSEINE